MKDTRFRVWDWTNKVMIEEPYLHFVNGRSFYLVRRGATPRSDLGFELLQYTGLKDRNGVEIAQGDLLKHVNPNSYHAPTQILECVHEIDLEGFETRFTFKRVGNTDGLTTAYGSKDLEVIGNIYENPELLEGVKE